MRRSLGLAEGWCQLVQGLSQQWIRSLRMVGAITMTVSMAVCLLAVMLGVGFGWPTAALAQDNSVDYTLTNQVGMDFSGKDLSGTSFAAADARDSNFEGADMSGTILTKATFLRTNLKGTDFSKTFADRVLFDGADMTNAIFVEAIATSSSFGDTIITGADFSDSIIDRLQVKRMCERAEGTNPVTGVDTRESLGCRD